MLYRTTNRRHNSDKLGILILVLAPTIVWFYISDFNLIRVITVTLLEIALIIGLLIWYRKSAFELIFNSNKIVYQMNYSTQKIEFDYSDLTEVHYYENYSPKQSNSNIFVFATKTSKLKLRTDLVESGESYVNFIKFLKSKHDGFSTYVHPKGTELHMRLRQEILDKEY